MPARDYAVILRNADKDMRKIWGEKSNGCAGCGESWQRHRIQTRQIAGIGYALRFRCENGDWSLARHYHPLQPYELWAVLGHTLSVPQTLARLQINKILKRNGAT